MRQTQQVSFIWRICLWLWLTFHTELLRRENFSLFNGCKIRGKFGNKYKSFSLHTQNKVKQALWHLFTAIVLNYLCFVSSLLLRLYYHLHLDPRLLLPAPLRKPVEEWAVERQDWRHGMLLIIIRCSLEICLLESRMMTCEMCFQVSTIKKCFAVKRKVEFIWFLSFCHLLLFRVWNNIGNQAESQGRSSVLFQHIFPSWWIVGRYWL